MATKFRLLIVAVPSHEEGLKLARGLVEGKLAACVNLVPGVESLYWWKGKMEQNNEVLLFIKTQKAQVDTVIGYVRENHPYEVPEVLSLPVTEGNKDYLNWVGAHTNPAKPIKDLPEQALEKEVG